jgi:sugar lactone lactonase YvrE
MYKKIFKVLILIIFSTVTVNAQSETLHEPKLSIFLEGNKQWTGIAVSNTDRVFVCFPRWTDDTPISVGEIIDNKVIPFPDSSWNNWTPLKKGKDKFICVQSVFVDSSNVLWVLDTGYELSSDTTKCTHLYEFDLQSNMLLHDYKISAAVISSKSYLNDFAIDNKTNTVYFSDSRVGGIVILELNSGKVRRVLSNHYSTLAEVKQITIEGYTRTHPVHSDGIALDPQKKYLYYCSLMGKFLYRISTSDLLNNRLTEEQLGNGVERFAETGANDGIIFDKNGNLYLTSLENNGISVVNPKGELQLLISDSKIQWPDSFSFNKNGELFFTTSQIHLPVDKRSTYKIFKLTFDK